VTPEQEDVLRYRLEWAAEALDEARHWVKQGRVPVEIGRIYRRFFGNRQRGDYGDFVRFTDEEVRPWIKDADRFVAEIGQLVRESLSRE
jgi:uncharacterized protein (UPF0332 family)